MTVLDRYLAAARQPDMFAPAPPYDEFAEPDGTARPPWTPLLDGLEDLVAGRGGLRQVSREVARLLADDNVTYTPSPTSTVSVVDEPTRVTSTLSAPITRAQPWRLDPLPLVLDEREWAGLEAGVVQRAELLDAIAADLYGARRLLARRLLPAAAVLDHEEYLRPAVGADPVGRRHLVSYAADLGRDPAGQWRVMSDRTQAPSGAAFAMANRRVLSRVLPEVYAAAPLHRLTPFFQAMRTALVDAAPPQVEDPRVVVLSPGTSSETAFDQAFVASLLGFPLLEGRDLTVRDGRVWTRELGAREPVDVVLRRVDSAWMDALELRGGSRLGVTGLSECVRRGTVAVVNGIGSGVLENPALLPFLPELCERLLGAPLRLPSVQTWWCGDDTARRHVLTHLDRLVVRPISKGQGRGALGSALTADQRDRLAARIEAAPHRFVGQEVLPLSLAPTAQGDRLVRRRVVLRSFAVRSGTSYTAMLGGLARVLDEPGAGRAPLVTDPAGGVAKDVWVLGQQTATASRPALLLGRAPADARTVVPARAASVALVPRVLSDFFWVGRYAERAEDLLRLVLAARTTAIETASDQTLDVLLAAVTHVSTTYPGFLSGPDPSSGGQPGGRRARMLPELRSLLLDRDRPGSVAQSLLALTTAAAGVRDQLSADVWMVTAEIERSVAALAADPADAGLHGDTMLRWGDAAERVLSGLLALTGIVAENMVRDPGWYMLDAGRGLERALQVTALLRVTLDRRRPGDTDRQVAEAVLAATESLVTHRRRYPGRTGIVGVLELLLFDEHNPRAVAYQLTRLPHDLRALPATSPTARPLRLLDRAREVLRAADAAELAEAADGERVALTTFLAELHDQLREVATAIRDQYQQLPPTQQPLPGAAARGRGRVARGGGG